MGNKNIILTNSRAPSLYKKMKRMIAGKWRLGREWGREPGPCGGTGNQGRVSRAGTEAELVGQQARAGIEVEE